MQIREYMYIFLPAFIDKSWAFWVSKYKSPSSTPFPLSYSISFQNIWWFMIPVVATKVTEGDEVKKRAKEKCRMEVTHIPFFLPISHFPLLIDFRVLF